MPVSSQVGKRIVSKTTKNWAAAKHGFRDRVQLERGVGKTQNEGPIVNSNENRARIPTQNNTILRHRYDSRRMAFQKQSMWHDSCPRRPCLATATDFIKWGHSPAAPSDEDP
jgi:hypothetical protein